VLYSFIFLVTKGASSRVCETSFGEPIGCPTPILNSKPDEEFAAKGGPKVLHKLFYGANRIVPRKKPRKTIY
jgi:hypothetical protein